MSGSIIVFPSNKAATPRPLGWIEYLQFGFDFSFLLLLELVSIDSSQNLSAWILSNLIHKFHAKDMLVSTCSRLDVFHNLLRRDFFLFDDKGPWHFTSSVVWFSDDTLIEDGGVGSQYVFEFCRRNLISRDLKLVMNEMKCTLINSFSLSRMTNIQAGVIFPDTLMAPSSNSASSPLLNHPCPPMLNISCVSLGLSMYPSVILGPRTHNSPCPEPGAIDFNVAASMRTASADGRRAPHVCEKPSGEPSVTSATATAVSVIPHPWRIRVVGQSFLRGGMISFGSGAAAQQTSFKGGLNLSFSGETRWRRARRIGGTTKSEVILYLLSGPS